MNTQKFDVLIIGAGIVGTSIARELQSSGTKVLLVERNGFGKGCSFANAGWITPCFSMPLPQPGMFFKSIRWLMNPMSPLHIKPELNLTLLRWLMFFLKAMNEKQMIRSAKVLAEISKYSLSFYEELARTKEAMRFEPKGLLLVSGEREGIEAAELEMNLMARFGIPGTRMNQDELLAFEPAFQTKVMGGVFFPREAHVEPYQTTLAILEEYKKLGGVALSDTEVYEFRAQDGKITEVRTTQGVFRADVVVMAAGTWSKDLVATLGSKIPLLGGKGYSMSVRGDFVRPQRPIMIVERKIAVTPRADAVRLAGTLELVDQDFGISARRVRAIHNGAKEYLKIEGATEPVELWRGLRPCTPDGVPLIGFSGKIRNLFYCVGHQLLGLQSAPGSARLAAELLTGKVPFVEAAPFRPARFER